MKAWLSVFSVLVTSCASQQVIETHQYIFPSGDVSPVVQSTQPKLLIKTDFSEYLDDKGLVYRTSDIQVVQAKHSVWAEDIKQQVTLRIINDLYSKQKTYWPIEANALVNMRNSRQLIVSFDKFNGVYTGIAELAGKWLLVDNKGNIESEQPFHIEVALQLDGYDALVSSLSEGVEQLTDLIAQEVD